LPPGLPISFSDLSKAFYQIITEFGAFISIGEVTTNSDDSHSTISSTSQVSEIIALETNSTSEDTGCVAVGRK